METTTTMTITNTAISTTITSTLVKKKYCFRAQFFHRMIRYDYYILCIVYGNCGVELISNNKLRIHFMICAPTHVCTWYLFAVNLCTVTPYHYHFILICVHFLFASIDLFSRLLHKKIYPISVHSVKWFFSFFMITHDLLKEEDKMSITINLTLSLPFNDTLHFE